MAAWLSTSGPRRLSVGTCPATSLLCDPTSRLTSLDGWSPIRGEMLSKVGSPSPLFRSYCITRVEGGQGESCCSLTPRGWSLWIADAGCLRLRWDTAAGHLSVLRGKLGKPLSPHPLQHIRTTSMGPGMLPDSPQSHTTKEKLEGKLEAER